MPITNALASIISDQYMNPATAAEHVQTLNGSQPARMVTAAGSINPLSDNRVILNRTADAVTQALALPQGSNGMNFRMMPTHSNAASWTLNPTAGQTVDALLSDAATAASAPFTAIHHDGVWYLG